MKQQAKEMHNNVGILDPQVFSATMLQFQTKEVTQAITKAMKHDFVVVIIAMKWDVVWYLDSAKTWPKRKFKDVVTVVNLAYSEHMDKIEKKMMKTKSKSKAKLTHKTDFPCTQQPSVSMLCGFYVALRMMDLLADISIMKKASVSVYVTP
ncbi:hypothetical protein PVAP13_2NG103300 [Panicum virgatum]|uniref:Uncharacterized protein n=1 Tax=Panicum virgatum TaxID=38727 RepID=A0A8T0VLR8_PANVG|nr:hypothetical protein PVAP13_2NG103300 [Panicum virgatum]